MTDAPASPTAAAPADDDAPAEPTVTPAVAAGRPGPTRFQRTTAIIATVAVAVAALGMLALLRPISTPAVDCGTSLAVLLDGRPNQYVDPNDPPEGVTEAEAKANNEEPCRDRVADAARPAVLAVAVGTVVALVALIAEVVNRAFAWRRRRAAATSAPPPSAAS